MRVNVRGMHRSARDVRGMHCGAHDGRGMHYGAHDVRGLHRGIMMRMMCYVMECPWNVRAMNVLMNAHVPPNPPTCDAAYSLILPFKATLRNSLS